MNKKALKQAIKRLYKESFISEKLDVASVENVISVIVKLPYPYSLSILSEYKKQILMYLDSKTLKIESANDLTNDNVSMIETLFKKRYSLMYTQTEVNDSLIAGVKITAGDYVFDTSIKNQIDTFLVQN